MPTTPTTDDTQTIPKARVSVNERQLTLLAVITRGVVVYTWSFFLFVIGITIVLLSGLEAFDNEYHVDKILFQIGQTLFGIVSCVGFTLELSVAKRYYGIVCHKCDKECVDICSSLAERQMNKTQSNLKIVQSSSI